MAKSQRIDLGGKRASPLTPTDQALAVMFGGMESEAAPARAYQNIPLSRLMPYRDSQGQLQHYRPYSRERLEDLADDIRQVGVLHPIVVRPVDGGYQIMAGHNRAEAARLAGLTEIPCMVREADDITAQLIVNSSNLHQRQQLSFYEKAWGYRKALDALEKMTATNGRTMGALEESSNENRRQIQRYVRLTYLIPELLEMVDTDMLPFRAGISLSYLREPTQYLLFDCMSEVERQISMAQAERLKQAEEQSLQETGEPLDSGTLRAILTGRAPNVNLFNEFSKRSKDIFPKKATQEDISAILELIAQYFSSREEVSP